MYVQLIYGANGSGKSQMVQKLAKETDGYLFKFCRNTRRHQVNQSSMADMFHMLTSKLTTDIVSHSFSEKSLLLFCYELESLLEMDELYGDLFIDEFPCDMDTFTSYNFFGLLSYLNSLNMNVTVTTCRKDFRDKFAEYFKKSSSDFKLVEL